LVGAGGPLSHLSAGLAQKTRELSRCTGVQSIAARQTGIVTTIEEPKRETGHATRIDHAPLHCQLPGNVAVLRRQRQSPARRLVARSRQGVCSQTSERVVMLPLRRHSPYARREARKKHQEEDKRYVRALIQINTRSRALRQNSDPAITKDKVPGHDNSRLRCIRRFDRVVRCERGSGLCRPQTAHGASSAGSINQNRQRDNAASITGAAIGRTKQMHKTKNP
jgi:hypothetical protein